MTLAPGQRIRASTNPEQLGTVLGPGAIGGTLLVMWDGAKGARVVRVDRVRLVSGFRPC